MIGRTPAAGVLWALKETQSSIGRRPIFLGKAFGLFRAAIAGLTAERTKGEYDCP